MTYKEVVNRVDKEDKNTLILIENILVGKFIEYGVCKKGKPFNKRILKINKSQYKKLIDKGYEYERNVY
jgi:hypothetical protein